jgi:hypothetical protein
MVSLRDVANMAPFAIGSSLILVIHDNMIKEKKKKGHRRMNDGT